MSIITRTFVEIRHTSRVVEQFKTYTLDSWVPFY